jgi:hypothetical protein
MLHFGKGFMGYRSALQSTPEAIQDLALSAHRRLREARHLLGVNQNHSAIYLGGLSVEMYLKTACFLVLKASPGDPVSVYMGPIKHNSYKPPFKADYESGHGLWFWSQELLQRRKRLKKPTPRRFMHVSAALYSDWYVGMRYRPGSATSAEAAAFLTNVEWVANNHATLRS